MATDVRSSREELVRLLSEWTPAWERVQTFPIRYPCTEEDYLALDLNRLLEFADGFVEVLPMPTTYHQRIVAFLYNAMNAYVTAQQLGEVLFAPLKGSNPERQTSRARPAVHEIGARRPHPR